MDASLSVPGDGRRYAAQPVVMLGRDMNTSDSNAEQHGNQDGLASLAKYSRLPIERIRYHADSDLSVLDDIRCGILFIMAFWSGPSIKAFVKLTDVVKRHDVDGTLELVVIDSDGAKPFYDHPEFDGKLGGWGEAAWVSYGQIHCTSGLGYNADCFEPNTLDLLRRRE